jgi:hypothetical protein
MVSTLKILIGLAMVLASSIYFLLLAFAWFVAGSKYGFELDWMVLAVTAAYGLIVVIGKFLIHNGVRGFETK